MTHPKRNHEEPGSSFTITQIALGSPLQFEPALGSKELDNLINNYVPGSAMPQQKRAQVVLEFLNSIDALSYTHPVSIRYHVPQVLTPQTMPRHSPMPSITTPPSRASYDHKTVKEETLTTSKSTGSLKRSREEAAPPNASSAKRLPGFSIMTKDGIDITDLASRGPKTKEQRDHAALMRKLKACAACKKSKQRCDPSHHRPAQSALGTPSSATPSSRSARLSCISSTGGSRGSISPQSSLGESFSQSPTRSFVDRATAKMGQCFPPLPTAKPSLSPSDFMLPDNLLPDSDLSALPMQDFDPELFQLAEMELDSWNADFTAFPATSNSLAWNNHEDVFAPNYSLAVSPVTQDVSSLEQVRSKSLPHSTTLAEQVSRHQDQDRHARQPGQIVRDPVYSDSHGVEFDIDQWLHSTADREDRKNLQSQRAASGMSRRKLRRDDYTVGWICPLGLDQNAAMAMLDDEHECLPQSPVDNKASLLCSIGDQRPTLASNPLQQRLQNPALSRDQDYILYPDSPQFDWGLEPHLISRDIGSKEWLPSTGAKSATSKKNHVDTSNSDHKSQGPASAGVRNPGSNYHVPGDQSTRFLEMGEPYQYLPSPSPSTGGEEVKGISVSESNALEAEGTAYDTQDAFSQYENQYMKPYSRHCDHDSEPYPRQFEVALSGNDEVDGHYSTVHGTSLSPGQSHNLRTVITADVDVGVRSQTDQCDNIQFELTQASMEMTVPDIQNHTINFIDNQQAQPTLINRVHKTLPANPQNWDHRWKERDLRRAGLLGVPMEGNHASRLRVSRHDMSQAYDIADDVYDAFMAETRRQSWRTSVPADLPGEAGNKYISIDTLTQHRLVLSQGDSQRKGSYSTEGAESHQDGRDCSPSLSQTMVRFEKQITTIMTLCILMTVSLFWTISLLIAVGNDPSVSSLLRQSDDAIFFSWNATAFSPVNSQNDERSLSIGHDYGSPCRSDPGPGFDQSASMLDLLYPGSDQANYIESNHILDSRPQSETFLVYDSSINDDFSEPWNQRQSPSPTFSSLSGTPALTMVPSTTKYTTIWTTNLPTRPTSQPREVLLPRTLHSQHQSSVRSPSSMILTYLKRTWSRCFNIGHLAMRITSLTIS